MIAVEVYKLIHVALQNCVNNYRPKYFLYKHSVYASLLCAFSEFWEVLEVVIVTIKADLCSTRDTDGAFYIYFAFILSKLQHVF